MGEEYQEYQDEMYTAPELTEEAQKGYVIKDSGHAAWVAEHIVHNNERKQKRADEVKARIEAIKQWQVMQDSKDDKDTEFYQGALRVYVAKELKGTNTKTLAFDNGRAANFRKANPTVQKDDDVMFKYIKTNYPEMIATKDKKVMVETHINEEIVDMKAVKKVFKVNEDGFYVNTEGEILPGYAEFANPDNFYVK